MRAKAKYGMIVNHQPRHGKCNTCARVKYTKSSFEGKVVERLPKTTAYVDMQDPMKEARIGGRCYFLTMTKTL